MRQSHFLQFFFILFSLLFYRIAVAQESSSSSAAEITASPTPTDITPAMSSSSVASFFSALATSEPTAPDGPAAGDAGSSGGSSTANSDAGASGSSSGSVELSTGAMVAVIVAVVAVCLFGIITSVLYYLAKKRSWEVRKKLRASARKVANALTPRRATFGKDAHRRPSTRARGMAKIDEVPPTPKNFRFGDSDVEKGDEIEMSEPPNQSKWARKIGR